MVAPPLLFCFGALIFGTLLLFALVLLVSLAILEDEPRPDIHKQMRSIRGQARHTARRVSEDYLRLAIELLNEKRQPR
jgi:hypothetical protein